MVSFPQRLQLSVPFVLLERSALILVLILSFVLLVSTAMDLNVSPVLRVITVQYHLMPLSYVLRAPMPMKLAPLSAKLVMQAIHVWTQQHLQLLVQQENTVSLGNPSVVNAQMGGTVLVQHQCVLFAQQVDHASMAHIQSLQQNVALGLTVLREWDFVRHVLWERILTKEHHFAPHVLQGTHVMTPHSHL